MGSAAPGSQLPRADTVWQEEELRLWNQAGLGSNPAFPLGLGQGACPLPQSLREQSPLAPLQGSGKAHG